MKSSISKKTLREFGLLVGLGLPILIGWIIPGLSGHMFRFWTLWIGIPTIFLCFIKPKLLFPFYKLWISLGHILGWANSKLILGLVFIIVLQPIALIMKLFGYDPLKQKDLCKKSYKENKKGYKIDLTRIF